MEIKEFKVETWLNPRAHLCKYNFGSSCVKAFTVEELFSFIGGDVDVFLKEIRGMSLHYGHFFGLERLRVALSKLYKKATPDRVLTVHGGTGANSTVMTELLSPADSVVAFVPNYQQHYSIPESLGAEVRYLELKEENGYMPDLTELASLIDANTKMITLSNPNNPTGAFIDGKTMEEICKLAAKSDAYVLCDEIYRGLDVQYMPSVVDLYEKGIATSSTSKVFSMAGTRLGWIATRDAETYKRLENRRSYDAICCGVFDELLTAIAMENQEKILERNRKIVQTNRAILDKWLASQPHLTSKNKSFSSTALVKYDFDIPSEDLCADVYKNADTLLCYGDCFEVPHSFRLGYGYVEPELLEEGLGVLGRHFQKLKA